MKFTERLTKLFNARKKENKESSSKIIDLERVKDSPFTIMKTEKGCCIAIGNNRITELMTETEAREKIKTRDYNLITSLVVIIMQNQEELSKKNNKLESAK